MYDKLTKEIEDRLRATSVLSAKEFVLAKANVQLRAALHSVDLAQGVVREAALASLPPALNEAARAQHAADTVAGVVAQACGRDELQCVQCWVCANFTPSANLRHHFIYHHTEEISALRELERRMPGAFPGVLTLWQDCSELGRFIEQGTLDVSHFHIEMHKTHAKWGVGEAMQRCDAVEIE